MRLEGDKDRKEDREQGERTGRDTEREKKRLTQILLMRLRGSVCKKERERERERFHKTE